MSRWVFLQQLFLAVAEQAAKSGIRTQEPAADRKHRDADCRMLVKSLESFAVRNRGVRFVAFVLSHDLPLPKS
jgi:hypothetical protein